MNAVYASYFSPGRLPGRTSIGVTGLALGGLVEIDLIARPLTGATGAGYSRVISPRRRR